MKIVVLTGAGISAESGIPTYRDTDGLWSKYDTNTVATVRAIKESPAQVIDFFNKIRESLKDKKPNAAHRALARLEKKHEVTIVTQNIDNLHEMAGSTRVIHIHGNITMAKHFDTGESLFIGYDSLPIDGKYRPDIVLFGEWPNDNEALDHMSECDLFISIGTSGSVFPAASYIDRINMLGKSDTIEMNITGTRIGNKFNRFIKGKATNSVPKLVRELNGNK